ncbi:MAG TPA: DUF882 domain-containing protein [Candidatus Binatia bacterium]|nr:DUF882 domain-containing protein [Candidatus Binatia bacterium]
MQSTGPIEPTQTENTPFSLRLGRRSLLRAGLAAAATAGLVPTISASRAWASLPSDDRTLAFYNTHTNETLKATYWRGSNADMGALKDINYILRDFRNGEVHPIDINLLNLLTDLHRRTGSRQPFQIISGYRSPKTNAMLAAESNGVAKHSMHLEGKAIDIRLADVSLRDLHDNAVAMKRGGVGIYPQSDFVHVDTGRVRYW